MKTNTNLPSLEFESVRFHFIYSFVLRFPEPLSKALRAHPDGRPLSDFGLRRKFPWSRKGWLPNIRARSLPQTQAFRYFDGPLAKVKDVPYADRPEDYHKIAYKEEIKNENYLSSEEYRVVNQLNDPTIYSCKMSRLLRLRSTGSGSVTITLDFQKEKEKGPWEVADILQLMKLTPRTWSASEFSEDWNDQLFLLLPSSSTDEKKVYERQSIDNIFCNILNELGNCVKDDKDKKKIIPFRLIFPEMLLSKSNGKNPKQLLDKNGEISEGVGLGELFQDLQVPYLYVDATVPSDVHKFYFKEGHSNQSAISTHRSLITKLLAAILLRFNDIHIAEQLSSDFLAAEFDLSRESSFPFFVPLTANSSLFSYVYRCSALSVCDDRKKNPTRDTIATLLDILESLRSRFNSLMVCNLNIDLYLSELAICTNPDKIEKMVEKLENLRAIIASQLCDPHTYLHDGQAGFDIMDLARDHLGITQMQEPLLHKLSLLDSLSTSLRWQYSLSQSEPIDDADILNRIDSEYGLNDQNGSAEE